MKRFAIVLLVLTLSGCRVSEEEIPEDIPDRIAPNFYGVEDIEITKFERFYPLEDVFVYDVQDGFLTERIEVEGQVDSSESGLYLLKYRVTDSDFNQTLYLRYVTVEADPIEIVNIFPYGDFFNELEGFGIYQEQDNGHANFSVVGGVLEVELLSIQQGIWYRPRLNTTGVQFNQGTEYRIQFDAKADDARLIQLQVGELIDYDPWFDKFDPLTNVFNITEEWQTFSYDFTMYKTTNDNGSILFEFGDVAGDLSLTTIYLDKIKILKINS